MSYYVFDPELEVKMSPWGQQIENENRTLKDLLRWRKLPEEMPKTHKPYIIALKHGGADSFAVETAWFNGREWMSDNGNVETEGWRVTHWRPIGQLPTEGGEG